jgi:hypothetical protein
MAFFLALMISLARISLILTQLALLLTEKIGFKYRTNTSILSSSQEKTKQTQ